MTRMKNWKCEEKDERMRFPHSIKMCIINHCVNDSLVCKKSQSKKLSPFSVKGKEIKSVSQREKWLFLIDKVYIK